MPRQKQRGPFAYTQIVGRDVYSVIGDGLYLFDQIFGVERDSVAEHVHNSRSEYSRRKKMKREFAVFVYDGVTGVSAALISDDDIIAAGQQIYHSAFALVAPVYTHDSTV